MKKGTSGLSIIIWFFVIVMIFGGGFIERLTTVSADVEYDNNMETENYQVDVTLGEDNSYLVKEVIQVDMLTSRHGIYRYVPQKGYSEAFDADENLTRVPYYAKVEILGCNVPVTAETSKGFFTMRLGDASATVYGPQTYELRYKVTPCFQEKDFTKAYYNLLPMTWQNSIPAGSSFAFHFPKEFSHEALRLYYGKYGSTDNAEDIIDLSWEGNTLTGTLKSDLPFLSGVTLYAELGEGYFTESHTIGRVDLLILFTALLVLLVTALLFFFFGRDEQIIPSIQYQPPEGLDSAAVGYIIDGSIEDKDILSLIIYWADKGYLKIEDRGKGKIYFLKTDKTFPADSPRYASVLFEQIFRKGSEVSLKSLKFHCAETISVSKTQLKAYVNGKGGIYTTGSRIARGVCSVLAVLPMTVFVVLLSAFSKMSVFRTIFYVADIVLLFVGICLFNNIIDNWYARTKSQQRSMCVMGAGLSMVSIAGLAGSYLMQWRQGEVFNFVIALVAVAAASGICVLLTGFMKKRTHQCVEWMGRLAGFRDFIETAELDRLKAMAEENPQWFYHILPYTYVFGLSDIFAKKLEGLAIPAPQWYIGSSPDYHMWNYYYFHRAFMGNMNTVSRALTVAEPPKDSGFNGGGGSGGGFSGGGGFGGGGGFSGGGFGGGGGGSW
ncbi:MAG: DUF2207 domain-containing protein [Eubacteriales bacterium]|nr:DUF2207 domain-containing protein [Eubacteriales bacterium]